VNIEINYLIQMEKHEEWFWSQEFLSRLGNLYFRKLKYKGMYMIASLQRKGIPYFGSIVSYNLLFKV